MSADAFTDWLSAEPVPGMATTVDLCDDDTDFGMPPLEADTPCSLPAQTSTSIAALVGATAAAGPALSLPLPLPVTALSSIVIQQTTHIARTVRTEVRASPSLSPSALPVKHTAATSAADRHRTAASSLHSARAAPSPHPATQPTAASHAPSVSSAVPSSPPAASPPVPDLIPPPAAVRSSPAAAAPACASAPAGLSASLSLSASSAEPPCPAVPAAAYGASSDPTDEFLADEGLQPRFSPWTAVSSPMPLQSYSAYLDTCERTLPPEALAALRKCTPGDPTAEGTHQDPFPVLRQPQPLSQPFTVLQRADTQHGLMQFKLVARRRIAEKEVIGFVAGHLETEHEAEREGVDKLHPSHIHIDRGYLHKYLGCSHSEAMVLSLKRFHNPLHHIRDPALFLSDLDEKRPEVSAYNVHVDLLLDTERRLPVVIAFAWVDIEEGAELTAYLGLGVWYSRDHQRLFLASRVNHWYHRKVAAMERLLDGKKIDFQKRLSVKKDKSAASGKRSASTAVATDRKQKGDRAAGKDSKELPRAAAAVEAAQADPPGPVLSASEEWRFLGDEEKREQAISKWQREQAGLSKGLEKVELWRVFALSQCAYVSKVFLGKSVSEATKAALRQLPDFIPAHIAIAHDVIDVDPAAIRRLVEVGHDEALCEVREVTSLVSPVRYYSAPWHTAFCVVARKLIKKGTFVFTYSGELEQEIRNPDSVYVYDVPADNIRAHWPACPADLPDMVIDAEKYGGVARFVNDSRYRMHEGTTEAEAENLNYTFVFVDRCIHLAFYVTRDVKAREELVSTYGDEFWSVCTGQMLMQHRRYYNYVHRYQEQLAAMLHKSDLPLPRPPPHLLELQPIFERKVALYPDEPRPTDTLATDEEWEVECILSKGRMAKQTHYLVKWLGFDDSYNSWVKKSEMACTKLIQLFEQQLKHDSAAAGGSAANKKRKVRGGGRASKTAGSSTGGDERSGERGKEEKADEKERTEAAGSGQSDSSGCGSGSESGSGSDDSDVGRQSGRKRKRAGGSAKKRAGDSSGAALGRAAAGDQKQGSARGGGGKKSKPSAEQRAANRRKIAAALDAERAKRSEARSETLTIDDETTDTEEEEEDISRTDGHDMADRAPAAPLLPPIAPEWLSSE